MRKVDEGRLQATLDYIIQFQREEGRSPSYRELLHARKYTSLGSVAADVARLKKRGLIPESDGESTFNVIQMPDKLKSSGSHHAFIVGSVHCGDPTVQYEDIEEAVDLPNSIFGNEDHVLLHAAGESMINRGIFDGDLLVVRRASQAGEGETIIAALDEDSYTCKILAHTKDGKPYLKAANDTIENGKRKYDVYPTGEWEIFGIVDYVIHAPLKND